MVTAKLSLAKTLLHIMPQHQLISNTNVMVLGLDNTSRTPRSDTILVVNLNPRAKNIGVISIPRDTRLEIPGRGMDKVNHAYAFGGVRLTRQAVSQFLGIPIPYYVIINLNGVADVVDELGGINMDIEHRMHYVDRAGDLYIDLKPGQQKLDGKKAVQYIRYRADGQGDIGRIARQQNFIRAVVDRLVGFSMFFKAPTLVRQITSHVRTNMPIPMMLSMAVKMREAYELSNVDVDTIPGEGKMINAVSYWEPDTHKTHEIVNRVVRGFVEITPEMLAEKKKIRIEVLNGNGNPASAQRLGAALTRNGYTVVWVRNAGKFNYAKTVLVSWKGLSHNKKASMMIHELNLPASRIVTYNRPQKSIDFSLVVGQDLR
jgi:LCP family protein required for cell wall assembly